MNLFAKISLYEDFNSRVISNIDMIDVHGGVQCIMQHYIQAEA